MHKLVLVAGFNPRVSKVGPSVRLAAGRYRLVAENYKDSVIVLCNRGGCIAAKVDCEFESEGEIYTLQIDKAGTESFINVFAELINGTQPTKSA